jgi:hypothetical protein
MPVASAIFHKNLGHTLTNVDDVTQDQPNRRALRASVVTALAGSAPHHATSARTASSNTIRARSLR